MALGHNADEYTQQLINLSPTGLAWSEDPESTWVSFLGAIAQEFARVDSLSVTLLNEAFPDTTTILLPNWERVAGLPDECSQLGDTYAIRRLNLLQKISSRGGQSIAYFISVGAQLGYPITITEFRPFIVGMSEVGDPVLEDPLWWFTWRINAPEETIIWFRASVSAAQEPLASWGNERLECIMNKLKPAHTNLLFAYG